MRSQLKRMLWGICCLYLSSCSQEEIFRLPYSLLQTPVRMKLPNRMRDLPLCTTVQTCQDGILSLVTGIIGLPGTGLLTTTEKAKKRTKAFGQQRIMGILF